MGPARPSQGTAFAWLDAPRTGGDRGLWDEFLIPGRGSPAEPSLEGYHLLPSVRGDFLFKLGRFIETRPPRKICRNLPRIG